MNNDAGREIIMKYVSQIRLLENKDTRLKAFSLIHFLKLINDDYEALNSKGLNDAYHEVVDIQFYHDTIIYSLCTTLVFNIFSLFEILTPKRNPMGSIRNKIGHGLQSGKLAFLNNNSKKTDQYFSNYEFDEYKSSYITRGRINQTLIISYWCFTDNNNVRIFKHDEIRGDQFEVKHALIESFKINNKPLYIDSVGNYVFNLDEFYELACKELEEYLSSII